MRRLGRRTVVLIGGVGALVAVGSATALGAWSIPQAKAQVIVKSAAMPVGPTPSAVRVNGGVKVSWTPLAASGVPIDAYRVVRYTIGHPDQTDQQRCTVTQGSQCVDATVKATQTYTYVVRAVHGVWVGKEGDSSVPVTITPVPNSPNQGPVAPGAHQTPYQGAGEPTLAPPTVTTTQGGPPPQQPQPEPSPTLDPPTDPPATSTSDQPSEGAAG